MYHSSRKEAMIVIMHRMQSGEMCMCAAMKGTCDTTRPGAHIMNEGAKGVIVS